MQHIFEFVIEKKEGAEGDPRPITSMYVTQSSRNKKVAVLIQKEAVKREWIKAANIKNVYLHMVR